MRILYILLLSFAATALGYLVTAPNSSKGWTNSGPQLATWERVDTDALNFTTILTNVDRGVLLMNNQVLSALVDGRSLSTDFYPPSAGWPVGNGFRLNFVKDVNDPDTIYAQSDEFSIKPAEQPTSSSLLKPLPSLVSTTSSPIISTASANPQTATAIVPKVPSTSDSSSAAQTTGTSNGALSRSYGHVFMLGVFSPLGVLLAA